MSEHKPEPLDAPLATSGKPDQVFVVQRQVDMIGEASKDTIGPDTVKAWQDIATVTIPANTPRRIALKEALKDSGLVPGTGPVKLRALDVKSAEVHEPEAVQPPVEWVLR